MNPNVASRILTLAIVVLGAVALSSSCGSVTGGPDGGTGGTTGAAGSGGGNAGGTGGAPLTCRTDVSGDCPNGFTCACGGPGPGVCTCHRNCSDANPCPAVEPMCGCPGTTAGPRFCVNDCFCNCR